MKTTTMIRIEEEILDELRRIAKEENRSLNQQIVQFCEEGIRNYNIREDKIREYNMDYEKEEGANK